MRFTINKKVFEQGIKYCYGVCGLSSESSPILSSILIEVTKNNIILISSNLLISTKYTISENFHIEEEGKFLIKGKILSEILSKLKADEISFYKIDNFINLKADKFDYNLNILESENYPKIDFSFNSYSKELNIKTNELLDIEKRLSNSIINNQISNNPNTKIFTSINLNFNNGKLEAVATDGYKLSYLVYDTKNDNFEFNIDPLTIKLISNLFKENEDVGIKILDQERIAVEYNNIILLTRVVEGKFPNYKSLLSNEPLIEFEIDRQEFLNSIERGLVLNSNKKRPIVKLQIKEKELLLSYSSDEIGSSEELIDINLIKSNSETVFVYNINFLISLIKNFSGDKLLVRLKDESCPMIITDNEKNNFLQLIIGLKNF